MDLKDKHDILKQQNKQLQVELVQEKMKKPKGFEGEVGLSLFEMLKGGAKSPHSNSMNLGGNSVRDLILSRNNSSAEKDVLPGFGGLSPPTQTTSLEDMLQGRQSRTFIDQTDRFHLQKTGIGEDE